MSDEGVAAVVADDDISSSLEESSGLEDPAEPMEEEKKTPTLKQAKKKSSIRSSPLPSFAPPPPPMEEEGVATAPSADSDQVSPDLVKAVVLVQAFRRRKVAQSRFTLQSKRLRVAQELLETEETYVGGLELMIRLYMKPLLASARSTDPIMPRTKVQTIFSVVEVMTNLNKVLLEDLKARLGSWHVDQVLGDIFLTMGDYLKVATQYVNNYETAVKTISAELKTNERFKLYYNEMSETPECKKNNLKTYLILPVQRIPRYEMLLKELIRRTPKDHVDYQPLNEAYVKIQSISVLIDSRKDENVKFQEVLRIHALLEPKVPNLIAPTRRFVYETTFVMTKPLLPKFKPCVVQCYMFNDLMVLAERVVEDKKATLRAAKAGEVLPPKYRPKETFTLLEMQCELLKDCLEVKCGENEVVLSVPEDGDPQTLVNFVKKYSKAQLVLEENSSSSNLVLPPSAGTLDDDSDFPLQKRTPSDPTGSRKGTIAVQPKTPSDPSRSRSSGNVDGRARAGSELVAAKTHDDMQDLAEQTKQGTVNLLQQMISELEEKIAAAKTELEKGEGDDEAKEKLAGEIKAMETKVSGMKTAMQAQASGQTAVLGRPQVGRNRSASEVVTPVVRQRSQSGFSFRGSDAKEVREPQSPSVQKKSLFGTVRKQRHKSASIEHIK